MWRKNEGEEKIYTWEYFGWKKGKEKNGSEKREDKSSSLVFTSRSFLSHSSRVGKQKNDR